MSWLKKIGQIVTAASQVVPIYGPLISSLIPGTKDDRIIAAASDRLDDVGAVIVQAEVFGQALSLKGADKAKAAAPAILQILLASKIIAGKKPKDEAAARLAAENVGKALADFYNAFED